MRFIAEFILSVIELLESEARSFKANILGIVYVTIFLAAGMLILLAGVALILWGFYQLLLTAVSPIGTAFIIGGATLLIGILMVYNVKRLTNH